MELKNLGGALKFGIDLETHAGVFYQYLFKSSENEEQKRIIEQSLKSNEIRRRKLERLYNDNIFSDQDTGIFEPIPSIESDDYFIERSGVEDHIGALAHAVELEEKSERFYNGLAAILQRRRRGIARDFKRMAQENCERKLSIMLISKRRRDEIS